MTTNQNIVEFLQGSLPHFGRAIQYIEDMLGENWLNEVNDNPKDVLLHCLELLSIRLAELGEGIKDGITLEYDHVLGAITTLHSQIELFEGYIKDSIGEKLTPKQWSEYIKISSGVNLENSNTFTLMKMIGLNSGGAKTSADRTWVRAQQQALLAFLFWDKEKTKPCYHPQTKTTKPDSYFKAEF